jgi:oligoribonuclease NrnB/cAMP/cGMP phosphodiesterase (DHH superfamily)
MSKENLEEVKWIVVEYVIEGKTCKTFFTEESYKEHLEGIEEYRKSRAIRDYKFWYGKDRS